MMAFPALELVDVTRRYTLNYADVKTRRGDVSDEFIKTQLDYINERLSQRLPISKRVGLFKRREKARDNSIEI